MCRKLFCRCWSFCINGQFLEDIIYTVLAYSFSFVLLLAVTSQFFQFHVTDSSFSALTTELIWEQESRKEKRNLRKKSACEKVQEHNLKILFKLSPWLIFLAFSHPLIKTPLEPATSFTLNSALCPGLLFFCSIFLKFYLALFHSCTVYLSIFITCRPPGWVCLSLTWERKVAWLSHLLSPKTLCSA